MVGILSGLACPLLSSKVTAEGAAAHEFSPLALG